MFNFQNQLPDFTPVGAGQKAVSRIPTGPTYREFVLFYEEAGVSASKALIASSVEQITIKINGRAVIEISGKHLMMLNDFYGNAFVDGQIIIPLSRHWMRTAEGEENLSWGTRNVTNIFIEVKLSAGADTPTLRGDADTSPYSRDLGMIVEIHNFQFDTATAGEKNIPDLSKDNGDLVALHLENADITGLEVVLGKTPFIEADTNLEGYQNLLERVGGRVVQDGYRHVDAMRSNRLGDAWPLAGLQEFKVKPTLSDAGSIPIVMETLSLPLGVANPV